MVRHKIRWLLVRLDFESNVIPEENKKRKRDELDLNSVVIYRAIKESFSSSFGVAVHGIMQDIQVRHYDEQDRLAMIKVPRHACELVRASITLLTSLQSLPVAATVISIHGSARTVRLAALAEVRRQFRNRQTHYPSKVELEQLELRLRKILEIDS